MPVKELVREYNFEDAKLSTEASRIKNNVKRDLVDFATRNITVADLDALQTAIDGFNNYPTDEELQGDITDATATKDGLANDLRVQMRPIRNMADLLYKNTGKYRTFGFDGMDKMNDDNLYRLALRVVRVGTKLLPEMAAKGLTDAMLQTLGSTAASFQDAIETQGETIESRDLATQERIGLGNALYARVAELASIGKSLFADTDEARYNDYVLYQGSETKTVVPPAV